MKLIKPAIKLLRPAQWIKNGFVAMPLIFSGRLTHAQDLTCVAGLLIAFCFASSATYVFNDYMDMEQDRVHPTKRNRPLASGAVSPSLAFLMIAVLLGAMVAALFLVNSPKSAYCILVGYLVLHIAYSTKLKDVVILDVLAIAGGFLLRVTGGAAVISVTVSSWLFLCTFSLTTFLALGKQSEKMMLTIPMVTYGIFRYMYLIYLKEDGGSPTEVLLNDAPIMICAIVWLIACVWIIYF
jgi:decaprenyl-phosphate phosphoribosyltransferase